MYINVLSIDTEVFKKCLYPILKVIFIGVPIKIVLPGFILASLSPGIAPIAYLSATVIAQIDPIAASKSLNNNNISKKSETILRAWSSFDDPITVLFAFYIFLPLVVSSKLNFNQYLLHIATEIIICFLVYHLFKIYKIKSNGLDENIKIGIEITALTGIISYSILSGSFVLPAFVGIFLRPLASEKFEAVAKTSK
ncbi:MAG: cation:proton antiporter [Hassallia sp.]